MNLESAALGGGSVSNVQSSLSKKVQYIPPRHLTQEREPGAQLSRTYNKHYLAPPSARPPERMHWTDLDWTPDTQNALTQGHHTFLMRQKRKEKNTTIGAPLCSLCPSPGPSPSPSP